MKNVNELAAITTTNPPSRVDPREPGRTGRTGWAEAFGSVTATGSVPKSRRRPTTSPRSATRPARPATGPATGTAAEGSRGPAVATGRGRAAGRDTRSTTVRTADRMTTRVTYLRRRAAVAVSVIALVVGLVLVMAQAGAALGGTRGRRSRSPPDCGRTPSCGPATRCGRSPSGSRREATPARWSTRSPRPVTARCSSPERRSSGTAEPTRIIRPRRPGRTGPPWLRSGRPRAGRVPSAPVARGIRWIRALPVLHSRRRQGRRLAPGRRHRRGPPPPGVPGLRAALHHLRARRGAPAHGGEALRGEGAVRRREAAGRDPAGGGRQRDRPGRGRCARRRHRGAGAGRGARGRQRGDRGGGARAAARPRPGLLRAVRLGLQGLRGAGRLRARGG